MNIIYIDHYAGSPDMGMEFRPYYLSQEWIKMGHKISIIAADYSHLRRKNPAVERDFESEIIDGIEYIWIKAGTYKDNGLKRAISMFRFVLKLYLHAKRISNKYKPDVVISSSTYPLDSFAGYRIAKRNSARYIHEAHDIWPLTLIELGGMSKYNPFVVLLSISEKYAYKHAESIVSVLPKAIDHMVEVYPKSEERYFYIPNGVVKKDWDNPSSISEPHLGVFKKLHTEGRFIVCYTGGITKFDKLEMLLDVAKKYNEDNKIAFVVVGKGMEKEALIDRQKREKLDNVFFLPPVSKKQIPCVLKESDASFIALEHCSLYRYGVSINKVYDYMMVGNPIIYGVDASNNEVEEAGCGVFFDCDSVASLYESIEFLRKMSPENRKAIGLKGKNWVLKNCEYSVLASKFLDAINR